MDMHRSARWREKMKPKALQSQRINFPAIQIKLILKVVKCIRDVPIRADHQLRRLRFC